jgi:hypothetical protein
MGKAVYFNEGNTSFYRQIIHLIHMKKHFKGFYLYFIILRIEMDGGGCFQGHTNIKYLYF